MQTLVPRSAFQSSSHISRTAFYHMRAKLTGMSRRRARAANWLMRGCLTPARIHFYAPTHGSFYCLSICFLLRGQITCICLSNYLGYRYLDIYLMYSKEYSIPHTVAGHRHQYSPLEHQSRYTTQYVRVRQARNSMLRSFDRTFTLSPSAVLVT
jgi:hypothetical protein